MKLNCKLQHNRTTFKIALKEKLIPELELDPETYIQIQSYVVSICLVSLLLYIIPTTHTIHTNFFNQLVPGLPCAHVAEVSPSGLHASPRSDPWKYIFYYQKQP
jgi:hypothetical protein